MKTTAPRRISRGSLVIPRSFGDLVACAAGLGSYLMLGLVALVVACTETKSPTGPESNFNFAPQGGARLALGARVVYLGAAKSKPVNFIRLRVYEENTTNVLGSLDKFLDPKISTFDFNFVVSLQGRKLNTKITMELANRDSVTGKETVNYAGRVAQTPLAPGDIRQLEIDLYPGPLSNFDVTAMHIVKPIVTPIEGDSVLATAVVTGGASDTRIEWTTLDSNVVSIDDTGMITTKLPGTARIVAAVGVLADTATMTVKQRLVAVTVTPTTATIKRGDSTTVVGKGVDPRGAEIVGEQVTWSVATDGILGLSPTAGRTIGQRQGVGTITATSVSKPTLKASAAVTVTAPAVPVATITVTPSTQTATALAQTKPYTAVAKDAAGNTMTGVVFQWSSSSTAIATVNASGVATAVAAGNATITAAVEEASGTAAFLVRPPGVQLTVSSGNNQTGTVKTAASAPVVAKVSDAAGNSVAGLVVTFATSDTAGVVTTASTTSNAQGLASTAWTFGTKAGTQTVTATSVGLVNSPLPFTATVAAGPPSQLVFVTQPSTTAANRTAFGTQPVIELQDQYGNPVKVAGNTITVTVASGGGTLTNATVTTDASGRATFTALTLGGTVGLRSLSFGMTGVPSITAPVTLTAGTATTITIVSGNGGSGKVGTVYSPSPVVLVTDLDGNPVPSTTLTLTPGVGGGTIQPGTITTGADGKATITGWTLKPTAGTDTLTVSTPGGSPTKIIVTVDPNPATQIAINGGSTSGQIGTALAVPPSVIVRDVNNIPVAGVTVSFAVASGGGTITGATQVTNASGIATVGSWTLGALVGANTMTATSGTLGGSPLVIAATALTSAATQMALNSSSTTGTAGQNVATAPSVIIKDASNNPVAGVPVTFSVGSGGGSITGVNQVSDANGIATLGSWKLGGTVGSNTVIATSAGLTNSPLTITATGAAGAATQMSLNSGSTTGSISTAVATPPSVLVRDANNNPVGGVTVTFAVATGGGAITGGTASTNTQGIATVGSWTLGPVAGVNTLTATSAGLTNSPLTISASSVVTGATQMALNGGSTSGTAGQPVATPPSVIVKDANSVPVAGVIVTFAVGTGGGSVTGATQTTNAQGIATVGSWTLGANAGSNSIIATSTGLTNSPLTITATSSTAPATQIASYSGSVTGTVGAVVATNPAVIVRDAAGNPVANVDVTFAVTGGGGTMTGTTQKTNAQGIATVGGWTLGTIVGTNTATATSGSSGALTGSPVTFTVAASASTASQMAINAGNNQTANAGSTLSTAPSVVVKDQYGNVVQGTAVTFAVTAGGGSLTGGAQNTNASGVATVGSWTLGVAAGANTLTATSTGLTGSPLAITATGTANAASVATSTITAAPTSITADGTTTSTLTVQLKDAGGQNLTASGGTVTITKASGPAVTLSAVTDNNNGTYTATVKGTVSGTATFSASLGGSALTNASNPTTVTLVPGTATKVAFTAQPTNAGPATALGTQPQVTIQDANGNTVTGSTAPITLALTTPGGATLTCTTNPLNATAGVATFAGCQVNLANTYTLTAASTGLTSATSSAFTIAAGVATKIALTTQPSASTAAGTAFAQQPVVTIQDAQGNTVTTSSANVTLALTTGTGTLSGTATVAAVNGVATFSGLSVDLAGTNKVLTATSGTLTSATTSPAFTITAGTATKVALTTQPSASTVAGTAFAQQPVVTIQDAQGNTVTSATDNVTIALTTGTGTLSGTATVAAVAGVATFTGLKINLTGTDKVLTATSGTLTSATTSPAFTITAGALDHFSVTKTDSSAIGTQTAGTSFNVMIRAQDVNNNLVPSFTGTVDMTSSSLFGAGGGTTGAFTAGVLSSLAVTLNRAGASQTLTATRTSGGTETGTATFNVNVGAFTRLQLLVPGETAAPGTGSGKTGTPSNATAGTALTSIIVNAVDANWNIVTTVADQVSFGTTDASATIPAAAFLSSGTRTYSSSLILKTAGNQTVTVSDLTDVNKTANTSPNILVVAGAATKYLVTANPVAGSALDRITVSAQLADANGNSISTSGITVNWTSSVAGGFGANGLQVASSVTNSSGIATVVDTLHAGGNTTTATDGSARTGNVTVTAAGTAASLTASWTNSGRVIVGGNTMTVSAQVVDGSGNPVALANVPVTFTKNQNDATSGYINNVGSSANTDPTLAITVNTNSAGLASVTYTSGNGVGTLSFTLSTTTAPMNATTYSPGSGATISRPALYEVSLVPAAGTGGAANSVSGTVVVNNGAIIPAQIIQKSTGTQVIAVQAKLKDALGGSQVSLSSRTITWTCSYDDGTACSGTFTSGASSAVAAGQTVAKNFTLNLSASDTAGRKYIFTATDGSGAVAGLTSSPTGASGSPFVGSATVEGGITNLITGTVQNQTGSSPSVTALNFTTSNSTFPNIGNDMLVAVLTFRGRTNSNDPRANGFITSVPTGWTLLRKDVTADPNDLVTYVYTKIRGASAEPATTTFGFSNQGYGAGVMFSMRGADTTTAGANLIDLSNGQANASGTSFSTPSITTTHAREKVLAMFTVDADGTGQQFTVPSGWTLVAKSDQTANSPMPTFIVIQRNAQTTGSVSATVTGTTAGVSIGTIIAVKQNTIP